MQQLKPQLTLRDLFWLVLVCGLALAWMADSSRLQQTDEDVRTLIRYHEDTDRLSNAAVSGLKQRIVFLESELTKSPAWRGSDLDAREKSVEVRERNAAQKQEITDRMFRFIIEKYPMELIELDSQLGKTADDGN